MYSCYVDESGHCGKKYNPDQPAEVLVGVLTDVSKLFKTQREQIEIINILRGRGIALNELKASDAYRGRKHWANVDAKVRDRLFELILGWVEERQCKFTVCPIDSSHFFQEKEAGCDLSANFGHPYEAGAVNVALSIERSHRTKKNNKGKTFIIFDEQHGHDANVLRLLSDNLEFTDGYTGYKPKPRAKTQPPRLEQVVDVPYFSKSHLASVIQLADWAAFVVNLYLLLTVYNKKEKYSGEFKKIEGWYKTIGNNLIPHTAIDPPGKDRLCQYYRALRPAGWSAKQWMV